MQKLISNKSEYRCHICNEGGSPTKDQEFGSRHKEAGLQECPNCGAATVMIETDKGRYKKQIMSGDF